jgi:DNA primase
MPLLWSEVVEGLDPRAFTIRTAIERMGSLGADPVRAVLDERPDLGEVLGRLAGAAR